MKNFILDTDSYKLSHFLGYPEGTERIHSYAESRGGKYPATVLMGVQKFVRDLADVTITNEMIEEAAEFSELHGMPFNREGWTKIVNKYGGKIPVVIKAAREGSLIPIRNVLVQAVNVPEDMPWLTSYIETALLRAVWYPTTIATRVHYMKEKLKPIFAKTTVDSNMDFAVLDFSPRGCTSAEAAAIGGLGHLVHFKGSDNIPAIVCARDNYFEPMAAFSVPATEHSIMTCANREQEEALIDYLIENMLPEGGTLSIVADTYDVYNFIRILAKKQAAIRAKNGTVVIRPDSGDIEEVLPLVFEMTRKLFDARKNEKGYLEFECIKILQGDGVNETNVARPFEIAEQYGISAASIMVGSGGGLMQNNVDRDTLKFAFKASLAQINGEEIPIAKEPITDPGKRSKKGALALVEREGQYETLVFRTTDEAGDVEDNLLRLVYSCGYLYNQETFADIRQRAANN